MKLQLEKKTHRCLHRCAREVRQQELTQEVRLPDALPDIGTILCAWGQGILRSKEWRSSAMNVSGGVMVWVLYAPEDGSQPRSLETWIPFQSTFDFPETDREGTMRVCCIPRAVDGRTLSARKLMLRVEIAVFGEALEPMTAESCVPPESQEGVELLRRSYPVCLSAEAGEKTFLIEENLTLPAACPAVEKLVYETVCPQIQEQKVMAGRLVFRGTAVLHVLYAAENGTLQAWDFEVPFSQFTELDREYDADAQSSILTALTSLELEEEDGELHLKCGVVAQYEIFASQTVEVVEDAYSLHRELRPSVRELNLPSVLERRREVLHAQQSLPAEGQLVDVAFFPDWPGQNRAGEQRLVPCTGQFRILYLDGSGTLQSASAGWEDTWQGAAGEGVTLMCGCVSGPAQGSAAGGSALVKADYVLTVDAVAEAGIPMVAELEVGEALPPDPARPSLVVCRAGTRSLWELARANGSTVEAIRQANRLQQEPEGEQLLLIPVL